MAEQSAMLCPAIIEDSATGLSLLPPQPWHAVNTTPRIASPAAHPAPCAADRGPATADTGDLGAEAGTRRRRRRDPLCVPELLKLILVALLIFIFAVAMVFIALP
ncbi:MAG: hypothetical protein LC799_17620 [Actinobacteria bacterium]|nr:hypothetical protein [Actinomycetota bacterium]